jgi:hypothetical protein
MCRMTFSGKDRSKPIGDIGVIVEAEDCVRLWQRFGELAPITFREAANGHHSLGLARVLEITSGKQSVD